MPSIEAAVISASVTMPQGAPVEAPAGAARLRERLLEETGRDCFVDVLASVGDQPMAARGVGLEGLGQSMAASHVGEVAIELLPTEQRTLQQRAARPSCGATRPGRSREAVEVDFTRSIMNPGSDFARILPASSASGL